MFLYIKKKNFPYLINLGQNPHTKNEHSKRTRKFYKNPKNNTINILKIYSKVYVNFESNTSRERAIIEGDKEVVNTVRSRSMQAKRFAPLTICIQQQ